MQAKKNHHYVWADYLKRWSQDGRNVYYVSPKGKIANDSVKGLAVKKHFYRCSFLSPIQLEIIRSISSEADAVTRKGHTSILSNYMQIQHREQLLHQLGNTDADTRKALDILNVLKANFLEDLHCEYENRAKPILVKLAKRDITPFGSDDEILHLSTFLGHQAARTSAFKQQCLMAADSRIREDMEGCWWFLSYVFGVNIGSMIYEKRRTLTFSLLTNDTGTNFITSDHPVVNLHEELKGDNILPPEKNDLFYPISPTVALMANDSNRFSSGLNSVDESFVLEMNEKISTAAEKTIFGLTPDDICPHLQNIGARIAKIRRRFLSGSSEA